MDKGKNMIDGQSLQGDKMPTRERILYASIDLFSQKGYEGVSMRDIAAAVDIKGSSIYKHYKSKQEIFECILVEMDHRYEEALRKMHAPQGEMNEIVKEYYQIPKEKLLEIVNGIFHYFLKDEYAVKFRRIFMMEQYRNERFRETMQKIYFDNAIGFQQELFQKLIHQGMFKNGDAKIMALQFYAPIYLLICHYDYDGANEEEGKEWVKNHVYQFCDLYEKG